MEFQWMETIRWPISKAKPILAETLVGAFTNFVGSNRISRFVVAGLLSLITAATLCTRTHTLTRTFSAFELSDAHVTHSAQFSTFSVQGRIEKSFHQVIRRWLEYDGYPFHYHELTPLHLRINSRCCLAVWRYTKQTQVMIPTSLPTPTSLSKYEQWNGHERSKVCSNSGFDAWRWRLEFSHVRHPVAASRECTLSVEQFWISNVHTSWERPRAKCSQSPTDTQSDQNWSLAITVQPEMFSTRAEKSNSNHVKNWKHGKIPNFRRKNGGIIRPKGIFPNMLG